MTTPNGSSGRWAVGRGTTRPILAYLVVVTLGVWVYYVVADAQQGSDLVRALVVAAAAVLGPGLSVLAFFALLMVPAMVLTIESVHRFEATSRSARVVLGAASWAAWGLFVAITLAVASRVVLVPETLGVDLLLVAASGALYSLLACNGRETRPGRILWLLALAVTASTVLGSIWMAGRWGGPASL